MNMNIIYIILILVVILITFEYGQRYIRSRALGTGAGSEHFQGGRADAGRFEENTLTSYGDNMTGAAVNIRKPGQSGSIGFFTLGGTSGETPAYLKCPSCYLQFDCANYPYSVDDVHGSVCTTCMDKTLYNEFNLPVYAKSVGSPRVCRDAIATK